MSGRVSWTLVLAVVLSPLALAQSPAIDPPKVIYGTWIWNASSRTEVDDYLCYVERLDDVGGGRTRVRDHRIRLVKGGERQVIRNDFNVSFNVPIMRADRTSTLWRIVGARNYQLMTMPARGDAPTFVVSRDISPDGQRMTQTAQGVVNGVNVRSQSVFDRAPDGAAGTGECVVGEFTDGAGR